MPLYEYECDACGRRFEVIQKFADAPLESCESCGRGPVRRLLSSPAIQFKGSGWYITDYAQKGKSDGGAPAETAKPADKGAPADTSGSKTDKKAADPAPAAAKPSPPASKS